MNINLELTPGEHKDLLSYCKLNKFNPEEIIKKCYSEGFSIEKYGLLSGSGNVFEKEVIKEVVKIEYVEVPVVEEKEVVKIEYVEIEKLVEVIKEVPIEKIVEVNKEVIVEKETSDNKLKLKLDALQNTVQKLKLDNIEKDRTIKEYEKTIQDIQKFNEGTKAMYLKGSNLDNKI
jgi:hypothetical protein